MPILDRTLPYTLLLPLAELEHVIHGGGAGTLEVDVAFNPTEEFPKPHPDAPAKLVVSVRKMNTRLVLGLVDVVLTPEQAKEKAEYEAWKKNVADGLAQAEAAHPAEQAEHGDEAPAVALGEPVTPEQSVVIDAAVKESVAGLAELLPDPPLKVDREAVTSPDGETAPPAEQAS